MQLLKRLDGDVCNRVIALCICGSRQIGPRIGSQITFTYMHCAQNAQNLQGDELITFVCSPYGPGGLSSTKNVASTYNVVSTELFLPTFGLRVTGSLCLWPLRARREFCSKLRGESLFRIPGQGQNLIL